MGHDAQRRRLRILIICPYRLFPLRGGGAIRCFNLLRQLAREHEVHAVIFQREAELREGSDGHVFPQGVRVYSPLDVPPPAHRFARWPTRLGPGLHYRWLRRSFKGPAESTLLRSFHLIESALREGDIELVLFEELGALKAAPYVRRLCPDALRVVNLYNVNHLLMESEEPPPASDRRARRIRERDIRVARDAEHSLDREVHAFWACSEHDLRCFAQWNDVPGFVIPNGVDMQPGPLSAPQRESAGKVLFCGSLSYGPNLEGLNWFLETCWPHLKRDVPGVILTIVGRGGRPEQFPKLKGDEQVDFKGEVEDLQPYYRDADVTICPLLRGSGTRLKILEAMSLGRPIVSSAIGAQGLSVVSGEHLLIEDRPQEFALAVARLLEDRQLAARLCEAARRLVETTYHWDVIGEQALASLGELSACG